MVFFQRRFYIHCGSNAVKVVIMCLKYTWKNYVVHKHTKDPAANWHRMSVSVYKVSGKAVSYGDGED